MDILTGQNLVDTIRTLCDNVYYRLWIASPYIGSLKSVEKILGGKWLVDSKVSVRLITDMNELCKLSIDTITTFEKRGLVKSLRGLHAKIYIIDNNVLITSANLTATAFSKRYEVGCLLKKSGATNSISIFDSWWKNESKKLPYKWWKDLKDKTSGDGSAEDIEGNSLPTLWELPKAPKTRKKEGSPTGFLDYISFCERYCDLATIYSDFQRLRNDIPLNLEIDGFLDYLFHHDGHPSQEYGKLKGQLILQPRSLTDKKRISEIKKYVDPFKKWVAAGNDISWRLDRSKSIQHKLSKIHIKSIQASDIAEVINSLNCMNSLPLNKTRFLNRKNNKFKTIKDAWVMLLHGNEDLQVRMTKCRDSLKYFGNSSVQELLGFYNPSEYPIRNSNVNAGLRFFGYDVSLG